MGDTREVRPRGGARKGDDGHNAPMRHDLIHRPLAGALFACVAMAFFSIQDATIKWLSGDYALFQIMFLRSTIAMIPMLCVLYARRGRQALHTSRPADYVLRCVFNVMAFLSLYTAVSRMPLADAVALGLTFPLFVTLLSGPVLGEYPSRRQIAAVGVGFVGVLFIVQPGAADIDWFGVGCALCGAFFFSLLGLQTRRMSATESTELMVFYSALAMLAITAALMPAYWVPPEPVDLVLMLSLGLVTVIAQWCIVHAIRFAPLFIVSPIEYTGLLWAVLYGWLLFDQLPGAEVIAGAVLVVGTGVYIVIRGR